jgi:putative ABC transport system permease protein
VIGNQLNQKLFAGENSVGRSLLLNDTLYRVIGVIDDWQPSPRFYHSDYSRAWDDTEQIFMPFTIAVEQFLLPNGNVNCWKPMDEALGVKEGFLQSECVWTQFWAELETPEQAQVYKDLLDNYVRDRKKTGRFERPLNTFLSPVKEWLRINHVVSNDNRVLLRLSFLFLLVCVVNTVGLLMAKFLGKSGEIALRRAMGASQASIFWQNLLEVALIGALGGLCGFGLAWLGLRGVEQLYRGYKYLVQLDPVMLLTAISLAIVASILAGLYPVWRVSRQPPAGLLKTQ